MIMLHSFDIEDNLEQQLMQAFNLMKNDVMLVLIVNSKL